MKQLVVIALLTTALTHASERTVNDTTVSTSTTGTLHRVTVQDTATGATRDELHNRGYSSQEWATRPTGGAVPPALPALAIAGTRRAAEVSTTTPTDDATSKE